MKSYQLNQQDLIIFLGIIPQETYFLITIILVREHWQLKQQLKQQWIIKEKSLIESFPSKKASMG